MIDDLKKSSSKFKKNLFLSKLNKMDNVIYQKIKA